MDARGMLQYTAHSELETVHSLQDYNDEAQQISISLQDLPVVTIQPNYNSLKYIYTNSTLSRVFAISRSSC